MDRATWLQRCSERFIKTGGMQPLIAAQAAEGCAETQAEVNGASCVAWDGPEDAADEEMTYWADDESAARS